MISMSKPFKLKQKMKSQLPITLASLNNYIQTRVTRKLTKSKNYIKAKVNISLRSILHVIGH